MKELRFNDFEKLFNRLSVQEIRKKFCGLRIGKGSSRSVYIFKPDDRYVVKIEKMGRDRYFANIREHSNWDYNYEWKRMSRWLAPVVWISIDGGIMIQQRAEREIDGNNNQYPAKIPSLITDRKRANFGWIGDQFVCVDYPYLLNISFRMTKAEYW